MKVGGRQNTILATDCTAAVMTGDNMTLIHSSDRRHSLYGMIYKSINDYYAFQLTMGKKHDAKQEQIDELVNRLQIGSGGRRLSLFYAVHESHFDDFVTNPVKPTSPNGLSIFHLKVAWVGGNSSLTLNREFGAPLILVEAMIVLPLSFNLIYFY